MAAEAGALVNDDNFRNLMDTHYLFETFMTRLRDRYTSNAEFADLVESKIAPFVAYEALRFIEYTDARVVTPTDTLYEGAEVGDHSRLLVPIPRAGYTLVPAFKRLLPNAHVGHVSIRRDEETAQPVVGEVKLPSHCSEYSEIFVLDPMLATGGSMRRAVEILMDRDAKPETITTVSVVAAEAGVRAVRSLSSEITILTAALDEGLNENFYIIPGLGDFGDRAFGSATSGVPTTV